MWHVRFRKEDELRSVLMISYPYPPMGGSATQRTLHFSRDLPQFGWRPVVLSVRNSPFGQRDPALMAQIPADVPVFRARSLELEHLYALYRRTMHRRLRASTPSREPGRPSDALRSLGERLQSWVCIPDGRVGWLPFAVSLGKKILRTEKPLAVFSTSPPYTANLIAKRLAEWSGLPWVMEFRDPWFGNFFHPPPTPMHRFITRRLEGTCVRRADCIVCVTPLMTENLCRRYHDEPASKFVTITNGFDPDDFDRDLDPDPDRLTIRHLGSLYGPRGCIPFMRGLLLAMEREPALREVVEVDFVGFTDSAQGQAIRAFANEHDLSAWVRFRAFVPHPEAVQLMQRSHVLLLILAKGLELDPFYPGKLFEYLGSGRPILAMASSGATATLVRDLERGVVASPDDPHEVAEAIVSFYSAFRQGRLHRLPREEVERYERRQLAGQLAASLDAVAFD